MGNDDFGKFLVDTLTENKVLYLGGELIDEAVTTMAFVTLDSHGDRSFTFARKPGADMLLRPEDIDEHLIKNCNRACRIVFALCIPGRRSNAAGHEVWQIPG